MNAHRFSPIAALALTAGLALLPGCGQQEEDAIRIGGIFSTTGSLAQTGFSQLQAARLAVSQINENGGVLGKRLVLVYRDDGTDVNKVHRAAGALSDEGTQVVVGTVSSNLTMLAADDLLPGAVMISGSATSPALTNHFENGQLFRTCATDAGEGRLLAQRALSHRFNKAAILRRAGDTEHGIADGFTSFFTRSDGRVLSEHEYTAGQESYASLLTEVLADGPQVIVLDADPVDGAQIVRDYVSGFAGTNVFWLFSHAVEDEAFVTAVGARSFSFAHEGTGPGTPVGRRYTQFADAYQQRFGSAPTMGAFAANVYDAVYLAALAIQKAGSTDPALIKEALRQVSLGGRTYAAEDYADQVKAIANGEDVNYEGASGSVDFDAAGDTSAPFDVWRVDGGTISLVERAVPAPQ
jgi:ABC-type branched-subunit amino acid transport system substrate-binding protein